MGDYVTNLLSLSYLFYHVFIFILVFCINIDKLINNKFKFNENTNKIVVLQVLIINISNNNFNIKIVIFFKIK